MRANVDLLFLTMKFRRSLRVTVCCRAPSLLLSYISSVGTILAAVTFVRVRLLNEPRGEFINALGICWIIGFHSFMHGDATEPPAGYRWCEDGFIAGRIFFINSTVRNVRRVHFGICMHTLEHSNNQVSHARYYYVLPSGFQAVQTDDSEALIISTCGRFPCF
jgi:hypothetical protein